MERGSSTVDGVFAYLDREFRAPLNAYINKRFRGAVDSEVVVQEALTRAAKKYARTKRSPKRWRALAFRIGKNCALDMLKRPEAKFERSTVGLDALDPDAGHLHGQEPARRVGCDPTVEPADGPAERYWKNELFVRRMNRLEPLQREVLILVGIEGFTRVETARRLGLSINQVRYAWRKGGEAYARMSSENGGPRPKLTGGLNMSTLPPQQGDKVQIAPPKKTRARRQPSEPAGRNGREERPPVPRSKIQGVNAVSANGH